MIKRHLTYTFVLAVILGSGMAASERARAFLLIGQTSTQSSNFLLVNPGTMALAITGMALKVQ
jgi:hypothetical protein